MREVFPGDRNNCNGWPVKRQQKGNLPTWALKNWLLNVYGGLYYPWLQELSGEFQANQTNQKNWAVVCWSFWLPNCPLDEGLLTSQQKASFPILHQSAWTEWRKAMVLFSRERSKNTTVHRIFRNSKMINIIGSTKATQLWSSTPSSPANQKSQSTNCLRRGTKSQVLWDVQQILAAGLIEEGLHAILRSAVG